METLEGYLKCYYDTEIDLDGKNLQDLLFDYNGKRVRITIEEIAPEETIQIKLKKIVSNDEACASLGINPWCVAEGADGNEWVTVSLEKAKLFKLV